MTTQAVKEKQELARCAWCGYEGIYKKEVIDTDFRYNGHDTVILGCKDTKKCHDRGGNHNHPIY